MPGSDTGIITAITFPATIHGRTRGAGGNFVSGSAWPTGAAIRPAGGLDMGAGRVVPPSGQSLCGLTMLVKSLAARLTVDGSLNQGMTVIGSESVRAL